MRLLNSTKKWSKWWRLREIDWNQAYLQTWNHPHRYLISSVLKTFNWISLIEIGCGAGANLVNIVKNFPNKQLGGIDVNKDAITLAKETLKGALLKVGSGDDIMMSDKATDVVLTDMLLIYVSPSRIDSYIKEIKRLCRSHIVLCEFHEPSFYGRIKLRAKEGYFAHDYRKLLEKHGFYDIEIMKLPKEAWPESDLQQKQAFIIKAKAPKR